MIENEKIPICVWNFSDKPVRVYREQAAATLEELPEQIRQNSLTKDANMPCDPVPDVKMGKELDSNQVTIS